MSGPPGQSVRVKFKSLRQLQTLWERDLSKNGLFVKTSAPTAELLDEITVVLELPDGEEVRLRGTVVHVVTPNPRDTSVVPGMGVHFDVLPADARARIEMLVRSRGDAVMARGTLDPNPERVAILRPEEAIALLRRVIWAAVDASALAEVDYYQLLGVAPNAAAAEIAARCSALLSLVNPASAGADAGAADPARAAALAAAILEIERTLTDPSRRAAYDARLR